MDAERKLVERRENTLLSLFELSHELGVGLDPYAIGQLTLFNLMGHFGATAAALWLLPEAESEEPVLLRAFGMEEESARRIGAELAREIGERLTSPPVAARLRDWREDGAPIAAEAQALGLALAAPVCAQGRLVGVAGLGSRLDGEPYGGLDLEYVAAAAGMVGVALENARLYHDTRESNRRLRETNERLAELDRLKSEFLSNVNHELRTPLAVTRGYLEVLSSMLSDPPALEAVAMATKHALKLETLLLNLLDFSQLEDRALTMTLGPRDLGDLLRDFADERRPGVTNGLREFDLALEPGLPPATCDERRLLQVLDELVDNAVKFTPRGSRLRLSASHVADEDGGWVAIEVRDDGPGIPHERLAALFEPFLQGNGSTTRPAGGMGLGLALARRLAEAMGGRLEAFSEPGVGSRFVVKLKPA